MTWHVVAEWTGASIGLIATAIAIRGNGYMLPIMLAGAICFALALADTDALLET